MLDPMSLVIRLAAYIITAKAMLPRITDVIARARELCVPRRMTLSDAERMYSNKADDKACDDDDAATIDIANDAACGRAVDKARSISPPMPDRTTGGGSHPARRHNTQDKPSRKNKKDMRPS